MRPTKPCLPFSSLLRTASRPAHSLVQHTQSCTSQQVRHATLLRRPHRPYTFTQLLTLSDGSTFTHRTTSPLPVYKSNKDTRNTPLWNPTNAKMANVEEDEAGRLRAFRKRFGRGWDAEGARDEADALGLGLGLQPPEELQEREEEAVEVRVGAGKGEKVTRSQQEEASVGRRRGENNEVMSASEWSDESEDSLLDLISTYGQAGADNAPRGSAAPVRAPKKGKK